jgi:drug/metabolite transporter (DMT)-like permease
LVFIENPSAITSVNYFDSWSLAGALIGFLLVIGFYAASLTSQLLGVSVVSVASKMSLMFPVLFSLFFMKIESKTFTLFNYAGMLLALVAIFLSSIKKSSGDSKVLQSKRYLLFLPFTVFLAGGLIDIGLNYSNYELITEENIGVYTIVLFAGAAISGLILLFFQKGKFKLKNLIGGVVLGIINFFSLYFVLKALTAFENNGAVFYPIYNVGIIMVSSFTAMLIFKERLSKTNFAGLTLAVLALFLLSYQDILYFFLN